MIEAGAIPTIPVELLALALSHSPRLCRAFGRGFVHVRKETVTGHTPPQVFAIRVRISVDSSDPDALAARVPVCCRNVHDVELRAVQSPDVSVVISRGGFCEGAETMYDLRRFNPRIHAEAFDDAAPILVGGNPVNETEHRQRSYRPTIDFDQGVIAGDLGRVTPSFCAD